MTLHTKHRKNTTHLSEQECRAVGTIQYLLEKSCEDTPELPDITADNHLKLLVCGEEGFASIATDIEGARHSIDLICWGFDPAMNLRRSADGRWRQENSFGQLLLDAAKRRVKVRLLVWYNFLGSRKQSNMPGFAAWGPNLTSTEAGALGGVLIGPAPNEQTQRHDACIRWYRQISAGVPGITLLKRDGQPAAIQAALQSEQDAPDTKGLIDEAMLLKHFGTHHQKTVLIDYQAPNIGVGYVMGLNSVTDYWDSTAHELDDTRREPSTDAAERKSGYRHKKPFQDYACRIEGGGALKAIHANFEAAWGRASGGPDPSVAQRIAPVGQVQVQGAPATPRPATSAQMPALSARAGRRLSRVQILRTQPEEREKSIKAFYEHSSEVARDYLYLENQYFFYPEWAKHFKTARKQWVDDWNARRPKEKNPRVKGVKAEDLPLLHLMVVIPEPEIAQMVPRTYETLRHLGQEATMRGTLRDEQGRPVLDPKTGQAREVGQDALIERTAKADQQYQNDVQAFRQRVKSGQRPGTYPAQPQPSPVVKAARAIAPISASTLEASLGVKVSTAMLYTSGMVDLPQAAPGQPRRRRAYRAIYIHSKLMIHSDACFTLGSANMNQRSMSADSEINLASDCPLTTRELRERVFRLHSGGRVSGGTGQKAAIQAFDDWTSLMQENKSAMEKELPLTGFLLPFEELRESEQRYG